MKSNLLNRSAFRTGIATVTATALLVGIPAVGAVADDHSTPFSEIPADEQFTTNGLNVVAGETVALTTDQAGSATAFDMYFASGQVSGSGSGELVIPTGPDSSETKQLTSQPGQVSNYMVVGGLYSGQMPITVETTLKVNGEEVDANEGYNLNGDVEITYTVHNHTSRKQEISYQNAAGETVTTVADIPVPFGDSMSVKFGPGWDITDPGSASMNIDGNGTSLSATLVLFPILEGVVGGTTQSLVVKARAQNANLPETKHTAVPVKLDRFFGGLAFELVPGIENKLLTPLGNTVDSALGQVLQVANLISAYLEGFSTLDQNYIDPLVQEIEGIPTNPRPIVREMQALADGLTDLAQVLQVNAGAKDQLAGLLTAISRVVGRDLVDTVEWLATFVGELGPAAGEAGDAVGDLLKLLQELDVAELNAAVAAVSPMCSVAGPVSNFYGNPTWVPVFGYTGGGAGTAALNQGISKVSGSANKNNLKSLQTALGNQSNASMLNSIPWNTLSALPVPEPIKSILLQPGCMTADPLASGLAMTADAETALAEAEIALDVIAAIAQSPEAQKVYEEVLRDLGVLSNIISNPNGQCTAGFVGDVLVNAIQRWGVNGLSQHVAQIAEQILSRCGAAQLISIFGDIDRAIAQTLESAGGVIETAEGDVPKITNGLKRVERIAGTVGKVFDSIPTIGGIIGEKATEGIDAIDGKILDALGQVTDFGNELQAKLEAMNNRGYSGDASPYGNAHLANPSDGTVTNYAAYQITAQKAAPYGKNWTTSLIVAVVFLILAVGVGTFLYRRRIQP